MVVKTKPPKRKVKKKKVKLTPDQRIQRNKEIKLHKDSLSVFRPMGFEYLPVVGFHKAYGGITSELDGAFLHENILVITEESTSFDKDHLRKKDDFYAKLLDNKSEFLNDLKSKFPEKFSKFDSYKDNQYKIFYIYITTPRIPSEVKEVYNRFKYLDAKSLKYLNRITGCIKLTARNEFFQFLGIDWSDVGHPTTGVDEKSIDSAVIIPETSSGLPDGIQLLTFVMKAEDLMDCAYVFRKDSWDTTSNFLYQRLIEPSRIESIRKFLAEKKRTFVDNIIVSLPPDVTFYTKDTKGKSVLIPEISDSTTIESVKIKIPYKINSIGIIDGQHRIFGHYRGIDSLEPIIQGLRTKRHLLVTGLYYDPNKFNEVGKRKFESELFLHINSRQKKVEPSLLNFIQNLQSPNSPTGIALSVLSLMNEREPFTDLFHLTPLDTQGIKTPTLIQYGLRDLVDIIDTKTTLFKYWPHPDKLKIQGETFDEKLLKEYIIFCTNTLSMYFNALKANNKKFWSLAKKDESKLLSVTSLVAFLLAYKKSLEKYGMIKDFEFYKKKIGLLTIDFSKSAFPYVSSQWPKFVDKIESECWT